ncbi:MAG TPA: carboxypeptidase regulatory-like domain-containing protein [Candidatus Acidoferrales bacterium]|nr:carboxypeptidase regulatory-like domain-containing protein [Candidatus Acidoferrales bacterium]
MKQLTLALCALVALCATPMFGQTLGEITGRVADPSGAGVPGATITLTSVSTNGVRVTASTSSGDYAFPAVAPGFYNIRTEHPGFKSAASNNVEVQVQQTVRLDVDLQVGQVSESVEVSARADLLQSENASIGTVIDNKGVTELPLNGRSYLNLVALASNVDTLSPASGQAGSRQGGDRANQSISAAGQRIMFDYFTLDGVSNTDPNFLSYVVLPSIDAIQEFKVQTGVYPAEFGHEATQINVLTKSGGNSYHGALFEFVRNDVFDAVPYSFSTSHPAKSPFKWNDYGFVIDGPVRIPKLFNGRNRLFFMANDEWKTQRADSQAVYTVPTAAMFTGDLSGLGTVIYDPNSGAGGATKTPFAGNVIPSSRLDPISVKFLKYYNSSNLPGLIRNYSQFNASPNNRDGFTLRMDFVESSKSQWTGRYSWGDENQASQGLSITGSKILTNYEQYLGSNTRTFTPNLVNEARFGYSRFFNSTGTYSAFATDSVTPLGIPGLQPGQPVTWGVPAISLNGDGFSGFGDNTDGPYANNNNTLQVVDNLSWIHGKHTFRFGFEYNRQNYDQVGNQFSRGNFVFQPNATQSSTKTGGDAFAEFLLGDLYQSTVAVAIATANFQRNTWAAFADDTWKVTPKLTLSLGLRYELTPPWTDLLNNDFTVAIPHLDFFANAPVADYPYFVREGNCTDPYAGLNIHWTSTNAVCSNGAMPAQLMQTAYKNFAPRIGISYSPDSKLVIRTGFGIFYNQDIGNAVFDMSRNIAARVTLTSNLGTPSLFYNNAVPGGSGATAQIPPPYAYVDAFSHKTSYTMQFLFNVQRQFGGNWLLEAGYLGGESHHLYGFQDANQGIPGTVGSATSRLPFANYGVIQLVADGANANYNSLSLKATRRFSQGLSVIGSYTWSKSIDDTSGIRVQGYDTLFPQNSDCIRCERGLSSFDVRSRFVTSVLYELPVGKGKMLNIHNAVANAVIGGWQSGGILTLQTGLPATLSIGGVDNASTSDGGYDRPVSTGISPYVSNPTPSRWLNPAAFVEAAPGNFGNVGRNTIQTPGIFALDAELHKQFRMPYNERHELQFRFEAFNVLNHPSWAAPNLNILSGSAFTGQPATAAHQGYGVISGTSIGMRQVQLGLKYSF